MTNYRKFLLTLVVVAQLLVSICFSMPQSSVKKKGPTMYTKLRSDRRAEGQNSKNRNVMNSEYIMDKIIPLNDKYQKHRSNDVWQYGDHDPVSENLGALKGGYLTHTLLHKVKRTINNVGSKLAQLQHDTRQRALQPRITPHSFNDNIAVKEEESGLKLTDGGGE